MLLEKLEEELNEKLNLSKKNYPFIFFFDKNRDFQVLIENLKNFKVFSNDNSLIELKYRLIKYNDDLPVVIYLSFDENEDLLYLMDYLVCSVKYHNTLYRFMQSIGIQFPKNKKKRNKILKLLPSLIREHYKKPLSFWNKEFGTPVIKDFDKKLKNILINPEELNKFDSDKREIFISEINKKFGFEFHKDSNWDLDFIMLLCVIEMYDDTQDGDYPLLQKLPPTEVKINNCLELIKEIRDSIELKEKYKEACFKIEKEFDLKSFIHKNYDNINTLLLSEKLIIKLIDNKIESSSNEIEFIENILSYKKLIKKKKSNFWVREGEILAWNYLLKLLDFLNLINDFNSTSEFNISQYIEKYYKIDQFYRIQKEFEWFEEGLENISIWIEKIYLKFLDKINTKFNRLFEDKSFFQEFDIQADYLDGIIDKNSAILMIDALRYELGKELQNKLEKELKQIEIKPLIALRPSITNIGFSSLIANNIIYEINDKKELIIKTADGANLSIKQKRIELIKQKYKKCECINIDDFLNIKSKEEIENLKANDNLILFSNDIDEMGESKGQRWIKFFSHLLNDIIRTIRKLIRIGITNIHILTDHGFLSFYDKDNNFKQKEIKEEYVIKKKRFLISKKSDIRNYIREDLVNFNDFYIYYPRSIYYFKKDSFFHGGISIQELLLPYIHIRVEDKKIKLRPQIIIQKMDGIYNKLFPILIHSTIKSTGIDPLVRSRKIKVWGEYEGNIITNIPIIDTIPGLNKVMLRIVKSNISKEALVSIIVQDDITEEILYKIKVEIKKDFMVDF